MLIGKYEGKKKMARNLSTEELNKRLNINNIYNSKIICHKNYNDIDSTFYCGLCHKNFSGSLNSFLQSKYRICGKCVRKVQKTLLTDIDKIKKEVTNNGYIPLNLKEEYKGVASRLSLIDKNGYKIKISILTLRNKKANGIFSVRNPYAIENLRLYCKKNNINCNIPNQDYHGWDARQLKVICECGRTYETSLTNFIYQNHIRCADCSKSKSSNEKVIENWLNNNKISYIYQYKFNDCKNLRKLPFDFYIKKYGVLEIDGEGHFSPTRFNGMPEIEAKSEFIKQKNNDRIKNEYCISNNIKLLRISYVDILNGNYKTILSKELSIKE